LEARRIASVLCLVLQSVLPAVIRALSLLSPFVVDDDAHGLLRVL